MKFERINGRWNLQGIPPGAWLQSIDEERRGCSDETAERYRERILTAFRETSDLLVELQRLIIRRTAPEVEYGGRRKATGPDNCRCRPLTSDHQRIEAAPLLFEDELTLVEEVLARRAQIADCYDALSTRRGDQWARR